LLEPLDMAQWAMVQKQQRPTFRGQRSSPVSGRQDPFCPSWILQPVWELVLKSTCLPATNLGMGCGKVLLRQELQLT
jgi:hypothetical protein